MANLCFNTIYLFGERKTLEEIQELSKKCIHDRWGSFEEWQDKIGFECEGWGRSYDEGLAYVEFNDDHLEVYGCTAWGSIDDYWDALCAFKNLTWCGLSENDDDIWVTNDPDKKWFPYEYDVQIWEANDYFEEPEDGMMTRAQLEKYLNGMSISDAMEFFEEKEFGCIKEIIRE